ncbi:MULTISPECIES: hypothetical protein [Streptomyces]|uniref:Uncharacterized protein n=1 Tax=Streptomyces canarius TaxID=285453 RepID=A0ABQ3DB97_9ACTN|nr:hypothetical protein [Streptomyces canarius]GHA75126.1 hypothetical protein GCM10010345_91800 [Streptomyces canarius]
MDAVQGAVFVLAGGLIWVLWRRYRYPGKWTFTFSLRYESEREHLAEARRRLRDIKQEAHRQESKAQAELDTHRASYERKVHVLEQRIAALHNPGLGDRLDQLGELTLFEHIVLVESADERKPIPLAELDVRFDTGQRNHSVYLTQPDQQVHRAKYPHYPATEEQEQRFDEDQVRDFAVRIQNTVARENAFRADLPQQLAQAQQELKRARDDTVSKDEADARLSQLRARHRDDPRLKEAQEALERARERWQALTGHLPPA